MRLCACKKKHEEPTTEQELTAQCCGELENLAVISCGRRKLSLGV